MQNTVTVILAGGRGSRLEPLTRDRAKPAVPFGGLYRIIDFALSNCLNSGMRKLLVLTQYKAQSLDRHISVAWRNYFCRELNEFIDVVPPQQRIADSWYQGTADAVYQNIYAIERERPEHVVVLAGDHIYKMNYKAMVDFHREQDADITVGALRASEEEAKQFGVMQINDQQQIIGFQEKPDQPQCIPGEPGVCLASMGIYVFKARFLFEQLCRDATLEDSRHDFGADLIPSAIDTHRVFAFPFRDENRDATGDVKREAYWRDVGTLDAYFEANMDLIHVDPQLNMYDQAWPIRGFQPNVPPPKFVFGSEIEGGGGGEPQRRGEALDSIVCQGVICSGGSVRRSIIGPEVRVNSFASVEDSILFEGVNIGRHAKIRRAIIDKGVHIPQGMQIGYDLELDRQRGFVISPGGVVVIARGERVDHDPVESASQPTPVG
ncbi:glucose-1-phosphate adenylyltransferase [Roseimaritima ulvae]|uniref:Glucose-1-phosphate adenylyltransferase n=1 Tax=Roseimaritima ulvae TaxID=980254 RepID=A0A5B9R9K1_9BACT|nr:glucose-1-phosphate adenylyltransferase [Roseimaritima ulvae]QEG43691.1 Glucose-1-phosphate adenylyltransferase [Roseimaritima ulvae]